MFCIECGARFESDGATHCPECGAAWLTRSEAPNSPPAARVERHEPGSGGVRREWLYSARALVIVGAVLLIVIGVAVYSGYRAGLVERATLQATASAREAERQFGLGLQDLAAGNYSLAVERFQFVLSIDPHYPGAAEKLAEAQAKLNATAVPVFTPDPETAKHLFEAAQAAYAAQEWDAAIEGLDQLRGLDPAYERVTADGLLFVALRHRGLERIQGDRLEEGIFDLDRAATIGPLDVEAVQQRQWAVLYLAGSAYYGINWPLAIQNLAQLYILAPYFKDTLPKLLGAYLAYGDALSASDPCLAQEQYASANEVHFDETVETTRLDAENACAFGTPTPGAGTGTPELTETATPAVTSVP